MDRFSPVAPRKAEDASRLRHSRYRRFARAVLVAALLAGLVPFGATGPFAMPIAALAAAFAAVVAIPLRSAQAGKRRLERLAMGLALLLAFYIVLQATGFASLLPPHPVWRAASDALRMPLAPVASVAPAISLATIPAIVAPFLLFVAGLRVASDDVCAMSLVRIVAFVGGGIALFGIAQFVLAPSTLLMSEKLAYQDSLTLVFVNRNTAATYLGCTILALVALLRIEVGRRGLRGTIADLLVRGGHAPTRLTIVACLFFVAVAAVALMLTKSRAGIACTAVAVAFHAFLEAYLSTSRRRLARFTAAALAVAAMGAVLAIFGGRVIGRASTGGVLDDSRFCVLPGIWAAARDAWPVGTGAGTFELVFRAYRDPSCGLYGTWRRAHDFFLEGSITLGAAFWVALVLALGALLAVLVKGCRTRRRYRGIPIAGLATLLLVVLHDIVDFSLQIPGLAFNVAIVLAASCAVALHGGTQAAPLRSRQDDPSRRRRQAGVGNASVFPSDAPEDVQPSSRM